MCFNFKFTQFGYQSILVMLFQNITIICYQLWKRLVFYICKSLTNSLYLYIYDFILYSYLNPEIFP